MFKNGLIHLIMIKKIKDLFQQVKAFCALRAKAYAYKLDDDTQMKKAKGTKK